jgi:MFS family permease
MTTDAPARNRLPLMALYTANGISMVGNTFAALAIPWFVLQTTGSAAKTGITGFFTILPVVLAGFLGGALVDRLGYKRSSILADVASCIPVALIPLLHFTIGLEFWQLMVLVFLGGLLDAPGTTAREALIPDLAHIARMPLERATSIGQMIERGSRLVGAPLAGFLVAALGTANVLWLDAASFLVSAVIVAAAVSTGQMAEAHPGRRRYSDELVEGFRFIRHERLIFTLILIAMTLNFFDAAMGGVILPVYVKQVFDSPMVFGLLTAAFGGGALLGALLFGAIGHRLPRRPTFVASFILVSLPFMAFPAFLPLPVLLLAITVSGIGAGPLNAIIGTILFERVPSDMRGRVLGMLTAGAWMTMPLGMLVGGALTEELGARTLLIAIAAVYITATISLNFIPVLRDMDRGGGAAGTAAASQAGSAVEAR